jgi:protein SCO1/2
MKPWLLAGILAPLAVAIVVLAVVAANHDQGAQFAAPPAATPGSVIAADAGAAALIDQDGKPFSLANLHGKVVLLYFGYTFCPDVCPTELGWIARVIKNLGADGAAVAPVFVTIDPARDTATVLKGYVPLFQCHLTGVTGAQAAITTLSDAYDVVAKREPIDATKPDGPYLITHSSTIYILDRSGANVGTTASHETVPSAVTRLRALITQGTLPPAP